MSIIGYNACGQISSSDASCGKRIRRIVSVQCKVGMFLIHAHIVHCSVTVLYKVGTKLVFDNNEK